MDHPPLGGGWAIDDRGTDHNLFKRAGGKKKIKIRKLINVITYIPKNLL